MVLGTKEVRFDQEEAVSRVSGDCPLERKDRSNGRWTRIESHVGKTWAVCEGRIAAMWGRQRNGAGDATT